MQQLEVLRVLSVASVVLLFGCATPRTQPVAYEDHELQQERLIQQKLALEHFVQQRRQLHEIGHELLVAAAKLCEGNTRFDVGFMLNHPSAYPEPMREFATEHYNLVDNEFRIAFLSPGLPASKSILQEGDLVTHVNGLQVSGEPDKIKPWPTTEEGINTFVIQRDNKTITINLEAVEVCDYNISLANQTAINAYAFKGNLVIVNSGLMEAMNESLIRQVVAHEIAHLVEKHNVFTHLFSSPEFEAEADYVGLYIVARAGYPVSDALPLWREIAVKINQTVFPSKDTVIQTHPTSPERFVAMVKTIEEIEQKQAQGLPLLPNIATDK